MNDSWLHLQHSRHTFGFTKWNLSLLLPLRPHLLYQASYASFSFSASSSPTTSTSLSSSTWGIQCLWTLHDHCPSTYRFRWLHMRVSHLVHHRHLQQPVLWVLQHGEFNVYGVFLITVPQCTCFLDSGNRESDEWNIILLNTRVSFSSNLAIAISKLYPYHRPCIHTPWSYLI